MNDLAKSEMSKPATERKAPEINPKDVAADVLGQISRSWFVRLPAGMIADDLKEPSIWKRVQNDRNTALRRHDRIYAVAFDESWVAETIVTDANAVAVSIAKPRITTMESRIKTLLDDGTYHIEWHGTGYVVIRNDDQHIMTFPVQSLPVAERELAQLHPRVA